MTTALAQKVPELQVRQWLNSQTFPIWLSIWMTTALVIQTELVVFSLLDPSIDNSWIYLRSQVPGTMTATIVMMRAAMDQKKIGHPNGETDRWSVALWPSQQRLWHWPRRDSHSIGLKVKAEIEWRLHGRTIEITCGEFDYSSGSTSGSLAEPWNQDASSRALLIWKGYLVLPRSWELSCMVLDMFGRAMPISIYTSMLLPVPQLMIFFCSSCRARSRLWRSSKRLVVGQLFSGCKRTGEMQKAGCLLEVKTSNKTPKPNNNQHKPQQKKKTSSIQSETKLRFQNNEILGALTSSSRRHRNFRK